MRFFSQYWDKKVKEELFYLLFFINIGLAASCQFKLIPISDEAYPAAIALAILVLEL